MSDAFCCTFQGLEYILVGGSAARPSDKDDPDPSPYTQLQHVLDGVSEDSDGEMEGAKGEPYEALSGWKIDPSDEDLNNNEG